MKLNSNSIFIDTNVLNGYYLNRVADVNCLNYLYSLKGKQLYLSSLSIGQFVAFFHKKFTDDNIKRIIRFLITKFTIIEFSEQDIQKSLQYNFSDLEDTLQYVIGTKLKCFYFVTNDKHFSAFLNIKALKPSEIRSINR